MAERKKISKELQDLVSWSVDLLGQAIKSQYGIKRFNQVESLRQSMKGLRRLSDEKSYETLSKEQKKLKKYTDQELWEISTSFTFMMELINRCENAFRSTKLADNSTAINVIEKPHAIIMVLTAHPTEARSPEVLTLFSEVQDLLAAQLRKDNPQIDQELKHLLQVALKVSVARRKKPSIADEAENIYRYILKTEILDELINFSKNEVNVMFRAWVGGDKDGHPGVDEKGMVNSLTLSRQYLLKYIEEKLKSVHSTLGFLKTTGSAKLEQSLKELLKHAQGLKKIQLKDGEKVSLLKHKIKELNLAYKKEVGSESPRLLELEKLIWIFPAIVVPLEVREDSEVVRGALDAKETYAIERMLNTLRDISQGLESKWYVRGFVLSMVESATDVNNGLKLLKRVFNSYAIPVVPLFENEKALTNGPTILKNYFSQNKEVIPTHKKRWGARFEVMVGYSDSSKENGVFASRLMVSQSLEAIEETLRGKNLTPVFFHGSGGSIERGGGSIKEQTSWMPKSALHIFKATVQGEMVARTFGDRHIFRSHVQKILEQLPLKTKKEKTSQTGTKVLNTLASITQREYRAMISSERFLNLVREATPYSHLSHLKIGSRPSKRAGSGSATSLRAIPWILCWTQTRILFPVWWGVGSALKELKSSEISELQKLYGKNALFTSYMNALGFTLAKVEFSIFVSYVRSSELSLEDQDHFINLFKKELREARNFYKKISGKKELLWFRPWLQQSIDYRSSMIHPINLVQVESVKRKNFNMFVDTVTGVSCGMLTTG